MSQSKLLAKQVILAKQDIKTRYLAGESIPSIARSYDVTNRNIYYHLNPLSPDAKAMHAKNSDLRHISIKNVQRKEEQKHGKDQQSAESTAKTAKSSLSDFVE